MDLTNSTSPYKVVPIHDYRVLVDLVLSLTQENAVDLHSVGRVP
jgi:hypothetical protein